MFLPDSEADELTKFLGKHISQLDGKILSSQPEGGLGLFSLQALKSQEDSQEELVYTVTSQGIITGYGAKKSVHGDTDYIDPVVEVYYINQPSDITIVSQGKKAFRERKYQPIIGEHIRFGESLPSALDRAIYEEGGFRLCTRPGLSLKPIRPYTIRTCNQRHFVCQKVLYDTLPWQRQRSLAEDLERLQEQLPKTDLNYCIESIVSSGNGPFTRNLEAHYTSPFKRTDLFGLASDKQYAMQFLTMHLVAQINQVHTVLWNESLDWVQEHVITQEHGIPTEYDFTEIV